MSPAIRARCQWNRAPRGRTKIAGAGSRWFGGFPPSPRRSLSPILHLRRCLVCHCMLLGESAPPRLSGMTWSTTQPNRPAQALRRSRSSSRDAASGGAGDRPPRRSRCHRRTTSRDRLGALRLARCRPVLIPVQPSPYDVWASGEMVALVAEALVFRPMLRAAFVVNRRVIRTVIGREARATLTEHRIAPLAVEIHQRIVFAESVATGRLAFELDSVSTAGMPAARSGGGSPVRQRPRRQARRRAVAAGATHLLRSARDPSAVPHSRRPRR